MGGGGDWREVTCWWGWRMGGRLRASECVLLVPVPNLVAKQDLEHSCGTHAGDSNRVSFTGLQHVQAAAEPNRNAVSHLGSLMRSHLPQRRAGVSKWGNKPSKEKSSFTSLSTLRRQLLSGFSITSDAIT